MAKRGTSREPEISFSNGTTGGYKLKDFLDTDILLFRLGPTTVTTAEYGDSEAMRVILVELFNWESDSGPSWRVIGEIYVFSQVIREALYDNLVMIGTLIKPKRSYGLRSLADENVTRIREKWSQLWPEIEQSANEANEAYESRQESDDDEETAIAAHS